MPKIACALGRRCDASVRFCIGREIGAIYAAGAVTDLSLMAIREVGRVVFPVCGPAGRHSATRLLTAARTWPVFFSVRYASYT